MNKFLSSIRQNKLKLSMEFEANILYFIKYTNDELILIYCDIKNLIIIFS